MINVDCLFQIVSHFLLLSTFWPHFILGQQKKDYLKIDSLLNGFNFFDPISFRADKKNYNLIVDSLLNGHLMVISGPFLHAKFLSSLFDSNLKLYFLKPHFDHWGWYWTPIFHFFWTGGIFEISTPDIPRFPEQGWYWTPIYHVFRTGGDIGNQYYLYSTFLQTGVILKISTPNIPRFIIRSWIMSLPPLTSKTGKTGA